MFLALLGLIPAIIFTIILFLINPLLGVVGVLWFIGWGIYAWKTSKTRPQASKKTSRKSRGSLSVFRILRDISKGVNDMARPYYGLHGRRSIERRKRRKW